MKNEEYIDINKIAELKGLKSNRSLRLAIQKGKYIAREVKVFGGKSYEILYSSLEPEIQEKLQDELIKEATQSNCTALVPINNINNKNFITESAKLTALARVDIVKALQNMRTKYKTKKEADSIFLDLFDLTKIHVYSTKGEFLCVARQVEKVHPMANHLGTVQDMEQYKQQIQKQQRQFKKAKKDFLRYFPKEKAEVIEIEPQESLMTEQPIIEKPKRERKLSPRELQMYRPIFNTDYEKYEWLMTNGCTNPEDRKWLTNYIRSDEYYNLYGD